MPVATQPNISIDNKISMEQFGEKLNSLKIENIRLTDDPLDDYQRLVILKHLNENSKTIKFELVESAFKTKLIGQLKTSYGVFMKSLSENSINIDDEKYKMEAKNEYDTIEKIKINQQPSKNELVDTNILKCYAYNLPNLIINEFDTGDKKSNEVLDIDNYDKCITETDIETKRRLCLKLGSNSILNGALEILNENSQSSKSVVNKSMKKLKSRTSKKLQDKVRNNKPDGKSVSLGSKIVKTRFKDKNKVRDEIVYSIKNNQSFKATNGVYPSNRGKCLINPNNVIRWSPDFQYVFISGIWRLYQDVMNGLINVDRKTLNSVHKHCTAKKSDEEDGINESQRNNEIKRYCKDELRFVMSRFMSNLNSSKHDTEFRYYDFHWGSIPIDTRFDLIDSYKQYLLNEKRYKPSELVKLFDSSIIQVLKGGYIRIQGTWLPMKLARDICTLFAFPIRYLLVPIFGCDFPNDCENWFMQRDKDVPILHLFPHHMNLYRSLSSTLLNVSKCKQDLILYRNYDKDDADDDNVKKWSSTLTKREESCHRPNLSERFTSKLCCDETCYSTSNNKLTCNTENNDYYFNSESEKFKKSETLVRSNIAGANNVVLPSIKCLLDANEFQVKFPDLKFDTRIPDHNSYNYGNCNPIDSININKTPVDNNQVVSSVNIPANEKNHNGSIMSDANQFGFRNLMRSYTVPMVQRSSLAMSVNSSKDMSMNNSYYANGGSFINTVQNNSLSYGNLIQANNYNQNFGELTICSSDKTNKFKNIPNTSDGMSFNNVNNCANQPMNTFGNDGWSKNINNDQLNASNFNNSFNHVRTHQGDLLDSINTVQSYDEKKWSLRFESHNKNFDLNDNWNGCHRGTFPHIESRSTVPFSKDKLLTHLIHSDDAIVNNSTNNLVYNNQNLSNVNNLTYSNFHANSQYEETSEENRK